MHREEILKVLEKYNYLDGKEIILFYLNSNNMKFEDYKIDKFKNINFVEVNLDTKKHFFIVDDHMNAKGHFELATQLIKKGRLAQLVEHLVYTERVIGSSPLPPTIWGCSSVG